MSAGVFPPTSSRSTKPRTSTRTPEFAGYADSMKERCSSGSAPAFCDGGGAGRIASLVPGGRESFSPRGAGGDGSPGEKSRSPGWGGLTVRGPAVRWLVRGPYVPPSPALRSPEPALLLARAHLCVHAPSRSFALLTLISAPADATWPGRKRRSLAAYLARYGEHGSHLRGLMRMNDPCPGNVLI